MKIGTLRMAKLFIKIKVSRFPSNGFGNIHESICCSYNSGDLQYLYLFVMYAHFDVFPSTLVLRILVEPILK